MLTPHVDDLAKSIDWAKLNVQQAHEACALIQMHPEFQAGREVFNSWYTQMLVAALDAPDVGVFAAATQLQHPYLHKVFYKHRDLIVALKTKRSEECEDVFNTMLHKTPPLTFSTFLGCAMQLKYNRLVLKLLDNKTHLRDWCSIITQAMDNSNTTLIKKMVQVNPSIVGEMDQYTVNAQTRAQWETIRDELQHKDNLVQRKKLCQQVGSGAARKSKKI